MLPLLLPIIGTFAPGIIKYLFGDNAGSVAENVINVAKGIFGSDDPREIEKSIASNPQLALEFKTRLMEIEDQERQRIHEQRMAELRDVQSAREMQMTTSSHTAPALAWITLGIFACTMAFVSYGCFILLTKGLRIDNVELAVAVSNMIGMIVGWVNAKADMVYGYYFGSSKGSTEKTEAMSSAVQAALRGAVTKVK